MYEDRLAGIISLEEYMKNANRIKEIVKNYEQAIKELEQELFGESNKTFLPDDTTTREQLAAVLHRYAQYKEYDTTIGENTNILSYDDAYDISEYAIASVQYAVGSGLMKGKAENTLNPKDDVTRAETAQILYRFIESNN